MVRRLTVGTMEEDVGWRFLGDVTYGDLTDDPMVESLLDAVMKIGF